jgi:PTH1 family peptidyl-tRNA hydrolase
MFFKSSSGGPRWIAVFLGNPGKQYEKSRHNAGFMTASLLEEQERIRINRLRFNSLTALSRLGGERLLLMKPQTYMNLSGKAVAQAAAFYKIPPERLVVICDDTALAAGVLRIRAKGSSGGHNGLKSIIAALGTEEFPRIKIGVGSPPDAQGEDVLVNWVLGRANGKDAEAINDALLRAADALRLLISQGVSQAMNKFN